MADIISPATERELFDKNYSEYWLYINVEFWKTGQLVNHTEKECTRLGNRGLAKQGKQRNDILTKPPQTETYQDTYITFQYDTANFLLENELSVDHADYKIIAKEDSETPYANIKINWFNFPVSLGIEQTYLKRQGGDTNFNKSDGLIRKERIGNYDFYISSPLEAYFTDYTAYVDPYTILEASYVNKLFGNTEADFTIFNRIIGSIKAAPPTRKTQTPEAKIVSFRSDTSSYSILHSSSMLECPDKVTIYPENGKWYFGYITVCKNGTSKTIQQQQYSFFFPRGDTFIKSKMLGDFTYKIYKESTSGRSLRYEADSTNYKIIAVFDSLYKDNNSVANIVEIESLLSNLVVQ